MPACITTDRGTHFTSGTWGDWCQKQGVQHFTTMAYHPQANGMVVRIHRTLKAALCACGGANAWKDHLPLIWECVLPPGRILVCLLWRRPYNSSW